MKTTDELRQGELAQRAEEFRSASQDRDVERMLTLFADDAQVTMAPGTFQGKAAIRKLFEWETRMAPVATSKDAGLGMAVVGRSVVWECQISETMQGVPCTTDAVRILEFDDAGLIRRYRSYYDKLDVMEKIASGMSGVYGWVARALIGYLVAQGKKGLDTSWPDRHRYGLQAAWRVSRAGVPLLRLVSRRFDDSMSGRLGRTLISSRGAPRVSLRGQAARSRGRRPRVRLFLEAITPPLWHYRCVTSIGLEHLARTAYEAHRGAHPGSLPPWEDTADQEQQAWKAADPPSPARPASPSPRLRPFPPRHSSSRPETSATPSIATSSRGARARWP